MAVDSTDIAICLDDGIPHEDGRSAPMAVPIVQTSLFAFPDLESLIDGLATERETFVYTRGRNPTVDVLEQKLARLERGAACKCFASGMAAVSAVMMGLLRAGDHVLFVNHTYGPTLQLATHLRRFGIEHDLLLDVDADSVRAALRPNTRLVWLESPGTMLCRTLDIEAVAGIAREHGALSCIDNSWATPLFQKPITLGVDVVVHSASKYIGGHSDVMAGAVIARDDLMQQIFERAFMLNGGILAPFDAWLLLRGLRTLPARMRQHHEDGLRVAGFLRTHEAVRRVFHPAFPARPPDHSPALTGYSGLFSFELDTDHYNDVRRFIDALRRFRIGVSWGGVESLIITPNRGTNETQLDEQRIPRGLVRVSIGLEGADVLIDDLENTLRNWRATSA
ncbi:MAG TPA: aminotransferase class I/II-fold pyridoxal phosphate-dependent enzyme [Longimicrobiales bacterium]|nr:aminotransferase class I/II-fold pyridoxal phosphate-dependent enzyme [Longimicrobiales bacterium]